MDIKPIRNDRDHREALAEIDRLWDCPDDSAENDRLDVLATLVEAYEKSRWPTGPVSPRDILEFAVADMGRSQEELGTLMGSRARAADLLSGRRRVSLAMARKISAAWLVPIQLLVAPYPADDTAA